MPRRAFDRWGARYFVLPKNLKATATQRCFQSLLPGTRPVLAAGTDLPSDCQVLINEQARPRSWIVHGVDVRKPAKDVRERIARIAELSASQDPSSPIRGFEYPLEFVAMLETDRQDIDWQKYSPMTDPAESEAVSFDVYRPSYLRCHLTLHQPGVMVLSDSWYPGWTATVDGEPAPLFYVNCGMRGLALEAGAHEVEMRYRCRPFELGGVVSAVTWVLAIGLWIRGFLRGDSRGSQP